MALIPCKECGHMISDKAPACPRCGFPNTVVVHTIQENPREEPGKGSFKDRQEDVRRFLLRNNHFFPKDSLSRIKLLLSGMDSVSFQSVECISFKDPTLLLIISVFLGGFGLDRFLIGDIKNGVIKLCLLVFGFLVLTGIAGIVWWIVDMFKIQSLTREANYKQLLDACKILGN